MRTSSAETVLKPVHARMEQFVTLRMVSVLYHSICVIDIILLINICDIPILTKSIQYSHLIESVTFKKGFSIIMKIFKIVFSLVKSGFIQ